jgi:hypothetical protein
MRRIAVLAAPNVNVPFTVWLAPKNTKVSRVPAVLATVRLLNVLDPLIVLELAPVVVNETLWNASPPPANVGLAPEQVIVEVPAVKVSPVDTENTTGVAPLNVTEDDPKDMLRAFVLLDNRLAAVTAKLAVAKAPFVTVTLPVTVSALPNVQPPPTPSNTTDPPVSVTPFVVTVWPVVVAANVMAPVYVRVRLAAGKVRPP